MNSSKRGISFLVVSVIAYTLLKRSAELFTRPRQPWFALRFTVKMVLRGKKGLLWPSLMCECIWLFGLQERNVVRNQVSALPITRTRVKTQFHEKKSCKSLYKMKIVFLCHCTNNQGDSYVTRLQKDISDELNFL